MLLLYNLLSALSLIIYLPMLLIKSVPGKRLRYIKERLGINSYEKSDIWVHTVSLGEMMASIPFLRRLKKEYPHKRIILSTTTHTGQKLAMERFSEAERIMYMPWDTGICIKRVINSIRPQIFITVETELWPVLFHTLKRAKSTIIILNGRLSNDSFKGYRKIRPFMKEVLSNVDYFYMQADADAKRIISIGADSRRVMVMGNLKFDIEIDNPETPAWSKNLRDKTILAGSTHKGEDEIILNAYEIIKMGFNEISLVLAPRHPERFNEVERILKERRFDYVRRTNLDKEDAGDRRYDIILLDTIGELSQLFSIATVTFVGGSLLPYGGHNILEPAYWGKPIIFGPYMDNFPFSKEFLKESASIMVNNHEDMAERVLELLNDPEKARQMGQRARTVIDRNRGATEKALELIRGIIGTT